MPTLSIMVLVVGHSAVCYWCAKLAAEHGWLHWVFEY